MGIESVTYINDFDAANPVATDPLWQGYIHIGSIKKGLKNTFQNIAGAVVATQAELNALVGLTASSTELNVMDGVTVTAAEIEYADGLTSPVQSQLDGKAAGSLTIVVRTSEEFTAVVNRYYVWRYSGSSNGDAGLPQSGLAARNTIIFTNATTNRTLLIGPGGVKVNGATVTSVSLDAGEAAKFVYVDSTTGWAKFDT